MESAGVDWVRACAIGEVSEEVARRVEIEGHPAIAIFQLGDAYHAIADRCTHGAASLSEGFVRDGVVECPFHTGTFDVRTGAALSFPCTIPVASYRVRVEGDAIQVALP